MVKQYSLGQHAPIYCTRKKFVDEIARMSDIHKHMKAFDGAADRNPTSICPHHQMLPPYSIKGKKWF